MLWVTVFFVALSAMLFRAILYAVGAIRIYRERDHPVNLVSSEQMDADDAKL